MECVPALVPGRALGEGDATFDCKITGGHVLGVNRGERASSAEEEAREQSHDSSLEMACEDRKQESGRGHGLTGAW